MVESRAGRMTTGFYTLMFNETHRLAYLWQRELFRDVPNTPPRLRLEFYELWSVELWLQLFGDLKTPEDRVERLREFLADGDVRLCRLHKSALTLRPRPSLVIYDGEQVVIETPSKNAVTMNIEGLTFPKSLYWSNLVLKEMNGHHSTATG